jgi:hypothetical protein
LERDEVGYEFIPHDCSAIFEPCEAWLRVEVFQDLLCKIVGYISKEPLRKGVGGPNLHHMCGALFATFVLVMDGF